MTTLGFYTGPPVPINAGVKPWIQASDGKPIDILTGGPEQLVAIGIEELARAGSHIPRFTGWAGRYSITRHGINVARVVVRKFHRPDLSRAALWHDMPEVITNDMSTPMQSAYDIELQALGVPSGTFKLARHRIEGRIYARMGEAFDFKVPSLEDQALIKRADLIMLRTERETLMAPAETPEREADWLQATRGEEVYANVWIPEAGHDATATDIEEFIWRHHDGF